jgi:hypothetical protein
MSSTTTRESFCGHHFITTYQQCPRQFFIKYILGYLPERIPQYLVLGKALHSTAAFYAEFGQGITEWEVIEASMRADFYREAETMDASVDADELYQVLVKMVKSALPVWNADLKRFKWVTIEKEILVPLANGFLMTQRNDALGEDRITGDVWVIERKNTQSSITGMLRSVNNEDQATAYVLGARRVSLDSWEIEPERIIGVLPEVSYCKGSVAETIVGDPIIPTQWQLDEYEARTIGLMSEIGQKTDLLHQGVPAEVLFGRAPKLCSGFLKCEYESICKRFLSGDEAFEGFRRDEAIDYTGPRSDPKAYLEWVRKEASK